MKAAFEEFTPEFNHLAKDWDAYMSFFQDFSYDDAEKLVSRYPGSSKRKFTQFVKSYAEGGFVLSKEYQVDEQLMYATTFEEEEEKKAKRKKFWTTFLVKFGWMFCTGLVAIVGLFLWYFAPETEWYSIVLSSLLAIKIIFLYKNAGLDKED